ncbi:MAG: ABC transporter substrate-binding protein [Actinomycetota bacterium]
MDPDATREERRVVTVLVADLVGSTALGERLDPEELRVVVGDAVARMVGAVEAFGGTVKDLAGDGIFALFGAPTAHEDDPERAIRAGLRIVEDVGEYAHEVERAWSIAGFGVRVGVNSGPVVTGIVGGGGRVEYGATGDTVNVAARLQSVAEPGQVLVGDATRRLSGPAFTWDPPVELSLKGKADPVSASAVTGVTGASGRRRDDDEHRTRLVGRDRELAAAMESVDAALGGSGHVLFLTGEPGIGKTRLLTELRAAFESGHPALGEPLWLEGRCVSYGESMPYWPFRDLLRSWLGLPIDEPELRARVTLQREVSRLFDERAPEYRAYLASLLGLPLESDDQTKVAELSPEAMQYRTFEVVRHLVARLAEDGPVALAVEDLHWADPTSLQLLELLLSDTEELPLLLLVTSRPEPGQPSWRVKEAAERELPHRTRELALTALEADAGRALLDELVGPGVLPAGLEGRILDHADGNPFYLEELVRSLVDAGALSREGDGWRFDHDVAIEVPPTVEKVILTRIDRLDLSARDLLMAASVLGRRFGLPLLEAVTTDDDDGVRPLLTELQRADLIREGRRWPDPEYRFKHALIQETAYRTLIAAERERLHRRAAEWLEARYEGAEHDAAALLAYHWLGASDREHAARCLTFAGDRARQEYALDEAIAHYRDLLPILEEQGERRQSALVLFKLALALHMSLRFAEANEAYQRAFDRWDPSEACPAPAATLRVASSYLPNDPDPRSAIAWPNIQLCMQLFDRLVEAWPERTIVPSLAERWEIADDGLRYVFHLREGTAWSDGTRLTAHDVEFGIKRVLNPNAPGSSVAIYFVLENGQDYYLRRNADADRIGVRALDERTVEFRLVAPAPYFLSVMNRPDGGPQPRHAIEADPDGWASVGAQVVSGPFRTVGRTTSPGARAARRLRGDSAGRRRPGRVRAQRRAGGARPLRPRRARHRHGPVHPTDGRPRAAGGSGRRARLGRVVRVPRVRPRTPGRLEPRPAQGARPRDRPRGVVGRRREHRDRDRRDRAAGTAGPHTRHRAGVRPRAGPDPPGAIGDGGRGADRHRHRVLGAPVPGSDHRDVGRGARCADRCPRGLGQGGAGRRQHDRPRADLRDGLAAGLRRSRVLPSFALPLGQPHERGRVLVRAVRRADRARAAGAERSRAPAAVPRGRSDGRRRPGRGDPDPVRAQHGVRQAVGGRLVGVREVLGELRGPAGRSGVAARGRLSGADRVSGPSSTRRSGAPRPRPGAGPRRDPGGATACR